MYKIQWFMSQFLPDQPTTNLGVRGSNPLERTTSNLLLVIKINLTNYIFHFVLDYQSFLFFLWAFYQLNDEFFLITRYLLNVL